MDDCGNYSTMEQVVNVIDTVAPALTISCPADTILYLDAIMRCGHDDSCTGRCYHHHSATTVTMTLRAWRCHTLTP